MTLLFKIIRAAHANGTHHKLALDALRDLQHPEADAWRKVFLRHADIYMEGAKAPDEQFKDFKNHVLHVGDNYWGGAPEKVQSWYAILVRELKAGNWPEAVFAAGVLCHYFCDPIHPFHTAQSEAENNIHRAVEWSISKSYEELRQIGESQFWHDRPETANGSDWLADYVCRGAEKSHASYGYLIAHYNFVKGVVDPPAGLDDTARRILAELIMYAAGGFAVIIDRALTEANATAPEINLTLDTVLAGLKIPIKLLARKMTDNEDRKQVERMYDELVATGRVEVNLPEDDRMVRELHAREVVGKLEPERLKGRQEHLGAVVPDKAPLPKLARETAARPVTQSAPPVRVSRPEPPVQAQALPQMTVASVPTTGQAGALAATVAAAQAFQATGGGISRPSDGVEEGLPRTLGDAARQMREAVAEEDDDALTVRDDDDARLTADDDVVDAPSIGPKTAARLEAAGVRTVGALLAADPGALCELLGTRHITARTIRDWQQQAKLVMDLPGLSGTDAQLLVGAGYSSAAKVGQASGDDLFKAVGVFAKSSEGQRILRFGKAPDRERANRWLALVTAAKAAA